MYQITSKTRFLTERVIVFEVTVTGKRYREFCDIFDVIVTREDRSISPEPKGEDIKKAIIMHCAERAGIVFK